MNWKEIDRVLEELNLPGTFIRDVSQPTPSTIYFSLYRPDDRARNRGSGLITLLCCCSSDASRLHRTANPFIRSQPPVPRFVTFLLAHVRGSLITSALQIGTERIVRIACGANERRRIIWFRLWSGASNCLVTNDQGVILEALLRRPKRDEVAGSHYDPSANFGSRRNPIQYQLRNLAGSGDYNAQLDNHYRTREQTDLAKRAMNVARRRFENEQAQLTTRISRLENARSSAIDFEQLRAAGQAILATAHELPWSAAQLTLDDSGEAIILVPGLSPAENARRYFDHYRRQRTAFERIELDLSDAQRRLRILRSEGAKRFLTESSPSPNLPARVPASNLGSRYDSGDWVLRVGRSATVNDTILRHASRGNDYWFHCRDHAGAHVFLSARRGKSPPLEILLDAATLALFFSKARHNGQADIHYTQVKNLRKVKGGAPGSVLPLREKNLFVRLDPNRLRRLLGDRDNHAHNPR